MKAPVLIAALLIATPALSAEREPLLAFHRLQARAEHTHKIETKADALRVLDEAARARGFKDHKDFIAHIPAEKLVCNFTEPFFTIEWDEATKEAKIIRADETEWDNQGNITNDHAKVIRGVEKVATSTLAFELRSPKGEVLAKLKLDYQGNDGMSDIINPYSAEANGFFGGCSTNLFGNKTLE